MIRAGLDVGTRTAKAVVTRDGEMLASVVSPVDDAVDRVARRILKQALGKAGVSRWRLGPVAATGYGRKAAAKLRFPDTLCAARAVHQLAPGVRTVIDIGGLVTRVVTLRENGSMDDYLENERCASGSGRFLEMIAEALETPLAEIGPLSLESEHPVHLTSQCVVFAESEVISNVNAGEEPKDILAGLHRSIAERVITIAGKLDSRPPVAVIGGVAKNAGVMHFIEREFGKEIVRLSQDPQLIAALGAALLASGS